MSVAAFGYRAENPAHVAAPRVRIRFRLLREGEVSSGLKFLRVFRDWAHISRPELVFFGEEFTEYRSVDLSVLLTQGDWLVCALDDAAPRKTRAAYVEFTAGGTYTFNITSGEVDGGAAGSPATLAARVRVDGADASREVVVIEKPSDGLWRLAGYGSTAGVESAIDVRVTDGLCYAIALDDWGIQYQPNLAVTIGQTIRPTVYAGWLYRITEAGTLPVSEPAWWPIDGDNAPRPLGSARAVAVRYYRPLAHGPVPMEMI